MQHLLKTVLTLCLFSYSGFSQSELKPTDFDARFYDYLINQTTSIDLNSDGILQRLEVEQISNLQLKNLDESPISLRGIEHFSNLETLVLKDVNKETLDLRALKKIRNLFFENCRFTNVSLDGLVQLTELQVGRGNEKLRSVSLKDANNLAVLTIENENNQLKELDVRGLKSLRQISLYADVALRNLNSDNLQELSCHFKAFNNLNTRIKSQIETLKLYSGRESVNVSDFTNLQSFTAENKGEADANPHVQIKHLTFENVPALKVVYCARIGLETLQFTELTALNFLNCGFNNISDLPEIKINNLSCPANKLTRISNKVLDGLYSLDCSANNLSELNLKNAVHLTSLDCSANKLRTLELGNCKQLQRLTCKSNLLEALELIDLEQLYYLDCRNNATLKSLVMRNVYLQEFLPSEALNYLCVDPIFLNNTKNFFYNPAFQINSSCLVNASMAPLTELDLSSMEKAIRFLEKAISNNDELALKHCCTRKGFEEIKRLKNKDFGTLLLEAFTTGYYQTPNERCYTISVKSGAYRSQHNFYLRFGEWIFDGPAAYQ
ncbi:hypothetical protein [Flavobacterium sp.]|uniref:hypothetical protein n=1 Tax=Flavobacterium sp. TaxID=239 RepID=UPI002607817C|nr:hypothetical protein [Flavobacterium sp.]